MKKTLIRTVLCLAVIQLIFLTVKCMLFALMEETLFQEV